MIGVLSSASVGLKDTVLEKSSALLRVPFATSILIKCEILRLCDSTFTDTTPIGQHGLGISQEGLNYSQRVLGCTQGPQVYLEYLPGGCNSSGTTAWQVSGVQPPLSCAASRGNAPQYRSALDSDMCSHVHQRSWRWLPAHSGQGFLLPASA